MAGRGVPDATRPWRRRSVSNEPVVEVSAERPAFTSASRSEGNGRSGHQVRAYNVITCSWHRLHRAPAFGPRLEHLAREKEFTRLRDQLSRQRRDLPWVKVDKAYVFDGPRGPESLADLFERRSQLVVQHFMFDPSWDEGCKSCSFWVDNFDGIVVHLNHRDVSFAL